MMISKPLSKKTVPIGAFLLFLSLSLSAYYWAVYIHPYVFSVEAYIEGKNITIFPESEGRIISSYVKEGDLVSKGQVLFTLDDALLQADQRESLLKLKALEGKVAFLKKTLDSKMKLYIEHRKDLDIGSIAKKDLTSALHNLEKAKNEYEKADSILALEKIKYEKLEQQLLQKKVIAPYDGVITKSFLQTGLFVDKKDPILNINNTNNIWTYAWVKEKDLQSLKLGMKTKVSLEAYPDLLLNGKIEFISPSTKKRKNKKLIPIKISIDTSSLNKDYLFCNGMTAKVKIKTK